MNLQTAVDSFMMTFFSLEIELNETLDISCDYGRNSRAAKEDYVAIISNFWLRIS